jgi:dephospho-CoA kinase
MEKEDGNNRVGSADDGAAAVVMVGLTGMPGAGKSTAGHALESLGLTRMVMGDVIREETKKRGLEASPENTGRVMRQLREKLGEAAVAELCVQRIRESKLRLVIVDGIRSTAEVDLFRGAGEILVMAIHASRPRRYELLRQRGRSDDPLDWSTFLARDERELGIGVARVISLADEVISNEHTTPEQMGQIVIDVVQGWMRSIDR